MPFTSDQKEAANNPLVQRHRRNYLASKHNYPQSSRDGNRIVRVSSGQRISKHTETVHGLETRGRRHYLERRPKTREREYQGKDIRGEWDRSNACLPHSKCLLYKWVSPVHCLRNRKEIFAVCAVGGFVARSAPAATILPRLLLERLRGALRR